MKPLVQLLIGYAILALVVIGTVAATMALIRAGLAPGTPPGWLLWALAAVVCYKSAKEIGASIWP